MTRDKGQRPILSAAEGTKDKDALLLVSFGGPEGMDDVMPFLENILGGKKVPRRRMLAVARHYELFGGVSPINQQMRDLIAALQDELASSGHQIPVYLGNRFWEPTLNDALRQMSDEGVKNALVFFTSPYNSYISPRMYMEALDRARQEIGSDAPQMHPLRAYYNHPGFVEANIENARSALEQIPEARRSQAHIAFTAHSIPIAMAQLCPYKMQVYEAARLAAEGLGYANWQLVYQSRSGPPHQPWLEPDIGDHLKSLKADGVQDLVIIPSGFISDNMEVIYDLDTEVRQVAAEIGLNMVRASTVGAHPAFVSMIRELIEERLTPNPIRRSMGQYGPAPDIIPDDCCLPG